MVDVCDPANFPPMKYFQQHELAEFGEPGYSYDYTRVFVARMEATLQGAAEVDTLTTTMDEYDFQTGRRYPGQPRLDAEQEYPWQDSLTDVLSKVHAAPPTTPFDFTLWFKSRVVMILSGRAWQFSRYLAPITTKHQLGSQYFDLLLHRLDPVAGLVSVTQEQWQTNTPNLGCRCISFFTGGPCRDSALGAPKILHGFSLNVELLYYEANGQVDPTKYLPITIDPDIENKGGNPGP